ncbi:MAG: precorrin-2 C(20)-methyltransferase [Methanocellales archaeon]
MKLYGIGVGPGDPELLTLKAYRVLKEAEMIIAPRSRKEGESLAWRVVKGIVEERRNKPIVIQPVFPMIKNRKNKNKNKKNGKNREKLENRFRQVAAKVLKKGEKCRTIAFITLGDPSLYSTFYKFLRALKLNKIKMEVEIIPGITSFSACSALAKVPIAEGEESAAIISRVKKAARNFETIIYMKPVEVQRIKNLLRGEKCRAILGVRVGMQGEFIISRELDEIPEPRDYFSILIIRRN